MVTSRHAGVSAVIMPIVTGGPAAFGVSAVIMPVGGPADRAWAAGVGSPGTTATVSDSGTFG